uniref:RRM domain-containing protein n=1 Tax=Glossina palpalis gambiensis TaxID=67801 RepID=A0A1B0BIV7_9MUSC
MSYVMGNGNNYQQTVNPSPVMMCPHMGGGITPPQHQNQMCGIDSGDQGLTMCGYNMKHSPCNCICVPIMELVQMNGRKVLGPPENWMGPPPTSACELFVRRIPKNLNEHKLLAPFLRFGRIYELRLPMDFNQANRGYAYVKYTTEEEAACAMEVLNHYYVAPRLRLEILHSYEKCRLFVNNIPKHLDEFEIEEKLRVVFPKMQRIYGRAASAGPPIEDSNPSSLGPQSLTLGDNNNVQSPAAAGGGNRGHVFVQFASHLHALEAKKSVNPGLIRLWGRDLKVVWANTGRDYGMAKTFFSSFIDFLFNFDSHDITYMAQEHSRELCAAINCKATKSSRIAVKLKNLASRLARYRSSFCSNKRRNIMPIHMLTFTYRQFSNFRDQCNNFARVQQRNT